MPHRPVLLNEALHYMNVRPDAAVADGTLGAGGHAQAILERLGPEGRLIGLDQDPASIARCRARFANDSRVSLHHENFRNLDRVLDFLNLPAVDAVILDVGFSSDQLEDAGRGLSFEQPGPLDMRMNPEFEQTAADLVNSLREEELANLFWRLGEEPRSRRFARVICETRRRHPIQTTQDLIEVIAGKRARTSRRHPATRVFQALRIAVNDELGALEEGLPKIWKRIQPGGRFVVITFHSLEDRIIKHRFRDWAQAGAAKILTKKPVTAARAEVLENPRSRSAKLRAVEKIK